ncbi:S-adenosyl-L-methionine-dependent methyltransferase [Dendrothele bispora CBS 962.96]|uniref:S-adenosyl-L-methionine-dependent methyltransferase n=1 Tax=Dendrothele bispora (strain CBS 962.96) TaxID=1314807 RepID=A0A4S8MJ93_DENBC|nr:S-adenosyl-L-methionine-dependent methyltransferase [Dendrothele bispora CBS 962.96]
MNFYFSAAQVLDRLEAKQGSIKGLIATLPEKDRKRTSALVIETLKYKPVLTQIINESKLMKEERKKLTSPNLTLILVHDLLLSGGIQAGDGPIKQAILRHKTRLHGEFQKLKIKRGVKSNEELAQVQDERAARIPRYVRVNTCLWTAPKAVDYFVSKGFRQSGPFGSPDNRGFAQDPHIPNLFQFHPQISFQEDPAYKDGRLILQDKASCFPAVILDPPAKDSAMVIDATSAPGNKTSHLSALMEGKGTLFAFERDKRRFSTLETMLAKAKCKNVQPINADFLTVDPLDMKYSQVTHILLDPSCSGSGIVNRLDYLLESEREEDPSQEDRLNKLASFQVMIIKHAMKFPSVQRVVYSTCSIHAIEDEHVVGEILKSDEALAGGFTLAPAEQVLPQWSRRGLPNEMDEPDHASSLVRCSPDEDGTNGFFVSCFIRKEKESSKRKARETELPEDETLQGPRKKKKKQKRKGQGVHTISIGGH